MTVLRELRDCLLDAILVVGDALRLLWRHWPALLSIFLLALAARNAVMWAALVVGREHPIIASLFVPVAPFAMVIALILMLQTVRPSARWAKRVTEGTPRERLAVLASVLVPFLTVYSLQGHLEEDRFQFVNEGFAEEWLFRTDHFGGEALDDRSLGTVDTWQIGLIIVVALLLRTVLDRLRLADRHVAWGFLVALVEVTWLTWVASLLASSLRDARGWVGERVFAAEAEDAWHRVTDAFGPLTRPIRALGDLVGSIVDEIGVLLVTPLAWLAVGAVVLAGGLDSRRARIEEHTLVLGVRSRMRQRLHRVPRPQLILRVLTERFAGLISGLRIIAHAGLLPVLSFCVLLGLPQLAEWGTALALRSQAGPGDPLLMLSVSPYVAGASRTVYTILVVVLVAAAVDRLLARPLHQERETALEEPATVTAPG